MISSPFCLTANRFDILCLCARYQSSSDESHLKLSNECSRYLKGTINLGLWYPRDITFDLQRYYDVDFAGCRTDRKSTSGIFVILDIVLCLCLIENKIDRLLAFSMEEAEYIAGNTFAVKSFGKQILQDFGLMFNKLPMFYDNISAISLSKNLVQHS